MKISPFFKSIAIRKNLPYRLKFGSLLFFNELYLVLQRGSRVVERQNLPISQQKTFY